VTCTEQKHILLYYDDNYVIFMSVICVIWYNIFTVFQNYWGGGAWAPLAPPPSSVRHWFWIWRHCLHSLKQRQFEHSLIMTFKIHNSMELNMFQTFLNQDELWASSLINTLYLHNSYSYSIFHFWNELPIR
jgi:hypothetical protein